MIVKFLICVLISFKMCAVASKGLPSYVKQCSLSDPEIEKCCLKHGKEVIPHFLNGDKKFNIPSFNPLLLDKIIFAAGNNLVFTYTNLEVLGFKEIKLTKATYDRDSILSFTIEVPLLSIKGNYEVKGKILLLPIEGAGSCDLKIINGVYSITNLLENMNFESKKPIRLVNSTVLVAVEQTIVQFDNLFNGNKELGDQMNKFLNENHKELAPDFLPILAQTINTINTATLKGVLGKTYFSDMFLP